MRRASPEPLSRSTAAKFAVYLAHVTLAALVAVQLLSVLVDSITPGEPQLAAQRTAADRLGDG